ncbi:hypothetical protein UPYG_G00049020 [Umbra pygmaea]|uniref:IRS-type PTB domain-containing protein n=1 Tax=Umbra pygmaea TaxID=75934 RepID=A0ABD0XRF1_UMBPY
MTDTVVAEGQVKFRDGKKWKSRWVLLWKPSPVADCLSLLVYRDKADKVRGRGERLRLTLEGICGVESGLGFDGAAYTLTILCLGRSVGLGFDSRDGLSAWDARIRYSLGEVHRFSVAIQPGTQLQTGPASFHLCNNLLVLTRDLPPTVIGQWKLSDLRRYGAVPNGFVFEGGTRCGYWAGVFFLSTSEGEQISFLFDCIVRGISSHRATCGIRSPLPDLNPAASRTSSEERISHEASELERRLSRLTQCGSQSSTASTFSYSNSVAGDDQSILSTSSSDTSQSDTSYGSRLPSWIEQKRPTSSTETLSAPPNGMSSTNQDECLYAAVMNRHLSKPASRSRGLQDSGRQSSLDSGIGIVPAGSQSSNSGSFCSCTGSLDTASQGEGVEFGSLLSLPPLPPQSPPPPPPLSPPPSMSKPRPLSPITAASCPSSFRASVSSATRWQSNDHQVLHQRYDTPRTLLQTLTFRNTSSLGGAPKLGTEKQLDGGGCGGYGKGQGHGCPSYPSNPTEVFLQRVGAPRQPPVERSLSWSNERAPSLGSGGWSSPVPSKPTPSLKTLLFPGCTVSRATQCTHQRIEQNYITHAQWFSDRKRDVMQANSPSHSGLPTSSSGSLFPLSPDASDQMMSSVLDRRPHHFSDPSVNYVNVKANASRELLYMELEPLEPCPGPVSSKTTAARAGGATLYAHIDISASESRSREGPGEARAMD